MSEVVAHQQAVLRQILKAGKGSSLSNQLGLQRLRGFNDFNTMYEGFCRAVVPMTLELFWENLGRMLPQTGLTAQQVAQVPHLITQGSPMAICMGQEGIPLPVGKPLLDDHIVVERHIKKMLAAQGVPNKGLTFYLHEYEPVKADMPVPLQGWHHLLESRRWWWEASKVKPQALGLPQGGSRWQWFNAMHDQLKIHGKNVEVLVTHPRTLIDFGLAVSQQAGRFMPLVELVPNLKALLLNHYDIGLQRTELGFLLAGLPQLRWMQWLYQPWGLQAWQSDVNIRQRVTLLTHGQTFYEFIPVENLNALGQPDRVHQRFHAGQVEPGKEYLLVVSTLAGLLGVTTNVIVKVLSRDPLNVVMKGPAMLLNGLKESTREDIVLEAVANINSALAAHGVFVREALLGHMVADRQPFWILEVSRPLSQIAREVMESIAKRLHNDLDLRSDGYRTAYREAVFKVPQVHFVPMGTFAAVFTHAPEFSQFDHSPDAALCKKVLAAAWESTMVEA